MPALPGPAVDSACRSRAVRRRNGGRRSGTSSAVRRRPAPRRRGLVGLGELAALLVDQVGQVLPRASRRIMIGTPETGIAGRPEGIHSSGDGRRRRQASAVAPGSTRPARVRAAGRPIGRGRRRRSRASGSAPARQDAERDIPNVGCILATSRIAAARSQRASSVTTDRPPSRSLRACDLDGISLGRQPARSDGADRIARRCPSRNRYLSDVPDGFSTMAATGRCPLSSPVESRDNGRHYRACRCGRRHACTSRQCSWPARSSDRTLARRCLEVVGGCGVYGVSRCLLRRA